MNPRRPAIRNAAIALVLLAAASMAGCNRSKEAADSPLRIGLLPIVDSLPFHIAVSEGFFSRRGVEVTAVNVSSPVERDQLLQAGEIDGMLNELSTTAIFRAGGRELTTVLTVRTPTADSPVFRILASPGSAILGPADLAGQAIGVSMNTIIEYLTERMLTAQGLDPDDIIMSSVPVIPERFQLLLSGDLAAATLPDPLAAAAIRAGAIPVVDDSEHAFYSVSVISFAGGADDERIERFVAGWREGVQALNRDPAKYRGILLETVSVPDAVQESYVIPRFPEGEIPTRDQWEDVLDWLITKGLIDSRPMYRDAVSDQFL